jgi:hypothetical protein
MRVSYFDVFSIQNGQATPKTRTRIGGVEMGPGVSFGGGVQMGGLDMAKMAGKDLEVEYDGPVTVIKGHY